MGCGESKIKSINLAPDTENEGQIEMTKKGTDQQNGHLNNHLNEADKSKHVSDEGLPNRLLSAIPISDLGESLDSRHLSESFNGGNKYGKGIFIFASISKLISMSIQLRNFAYKRLLNKPYENEVTLRQQN